MLNPFLHIWGIVHKKSMGISHKEREKGLYKEKYSIYNNILCQSG